MHLILHTTCATCELGIVCGTLLYLFSLKSTARVIGNQAIEAEIAREIAWTFLSLISAVFGLTLMIFGASRAYHAFLTTVDKIRHSAKTNQVRPTNGTAEVTELKSGSDGPEYA